MKKQEDLKPELVVPLAHLNRLSTTTCTAGNELFASGCTGGDAILWNKDGKLLRKLVGEGLAGYNVGSGIRGVSISPDKDRPSLFVSYESGLSVLWDCTTGDSIFVAKDNSAICQPFFSKNGDKIIGYCLDECIAVLDVKSGHSLKKIIIKSQFQLLAFNEHTIVLYPKYAGKKNLVFIDASTEKSTTIEINHNNEFLAGKLSPDSEKLVALGTSSGFVLETRTGKQTVLVFGEIEGQSFENVCIQFSPDNSKIYTFIGSRNTWVFIICRLTIAAAINAIFT